MDILDQLGKDPELIRPPARVVSLVPSMTESLFDLGFGTQLVGITDYCIHPESKVKAKLSVGDVKNSDINRILTLKPDLIIANREENSEKTIKELHDAGLPIWLTFPKTVDQSISLLYDLLAIFHTDRQTLIIKTMTTSLDWTRSVYQNSTPMRYFCPVWQDVEEGVDWWMTFNSDVYADNLLSIFSGENIFAERQRIYPLKADLGLQEADNPGLRDRRYPCVKMEEIINADPELILLPSEPFDYKNAHLEKIKEQFPSTTAVKTNNVHLVDGTYLFWYGTRLAKALQSLPQYFDN